MDTELPAAGWYAHPEMTGTQRYWDGQQWTDHIAPGAQQPEDPAQIQTDAVASGILKACVVIGAIAVALAVVYFMYAAYSDLDCTSRNIDRAEAGQPTEDCG